MSEYENAVDRYNQKIETMRGEAEALSMRTLEILETISHENPFESPGEFEEFLYELTMELSSAGDYECTPESQEFDISNDVSRAFYLLDQVSEAAEKEIERRENELREHSEYRKAMNFLEVATATTYPDWSNLERQIEEFADSEIAEVAVKDGKEKYN